MVFSEIEQGDIHRIIDLTLRFLTRGKVIKEEILDSVGEGNYFGYKCCAENGELAGFMTFKKGLSFTFPHPELEKEVRVISSGKIVYLADGLWVSPGYRSQGIGAALFRKVGEGIAKTNADFLLIEEWVYPTGESPIGMLTHIWGTPVYAKSIPMFYKGMEKYGLTCPICGRDCKCSANVFVFDVNNMRAIL